MEQVPGMFSVENKAFAVVVPVDGEKNLPIIGKAYTIHVDVSDEDKLYYWNPSIQDYGVLGEATGTTSLTGIVNNLLSEDPNAALAAPHKCKFVCGFYV